ncbi:alanine--tRNA ligase [Bradyrhizobium betae]|uniref:alanine--tRNA ligase n=1 Tax=Bradyrhizobium betae TaxID=244734 RepID=UPI003D67FF59
MNNTINDVRSAFLDYFIKQGHTHVPSASLLPVNDPTLLFVNSGMAPFKDVFTGVETRPYTRATTAQKCVRLGGKHNDLDNVGFTARHHTFFEMLGNFSFGDYFKEFAIHAAWNLLTKEFGLPIEKLLVTIYASDDEAAALWKKIGGLSDNKIIRIDNDDNFWRMGDLGPCGPSSEIFFDHGDHIAGGPPGSSDQDGDRFVEIWNLVFMQYNQITPDEMQPLPKFCIDTGSGIERLAAALQGKSDNYDTDLLRSLILASADLTKVDPDGALKSSHRVVADHVRTSAFLLADGVTPGNEGRGYVLRRVMRRAMRHAHLLGAKDPLMYRLVPELVTLMGAAYPELIRAQPFIMETLRLEETRFRQTLDRGLKLLGDEIGKLTSGAPLPGEVAFRLYDTYGFPIDLTQDALRSRDISVDLVGFNDAMAKQKALARESWVGSGDLATSKVWFDLRDEFGSTEFMGYETEAASANVTGIVVDGARSNEARESDIVQITLNQTPFYAESGGQVGDSGQLKLEDGSVVDVTNTVKELGQLWVHRGTVVKGNVKVGDKVRAIVDSKRRAAIRANHSATHLLHEALRERFGDHIAQKGSLVAPDRLRFDFSHPMPLTSEDLTTIEAEVNRQIRGNSEVTTRIMSLAEAQGSGARALFGEKYGDEVRVVAMGTPTRSDHAAYSVELCGGTHVRRTGDIGLLKVTGESSVGSGVRRIEALTGEGALTYANKLISLVRAIGSNLGISTDEQILTHVVQLQEQIKSKDNTIRQLRIDSLKASTASPCIRDIGGVKFDVRVGDWPVPDLRRMADEMKKSIGSGVVALISTAEGKASVVIGVTPDLVGELDAVHLAKVAAEAFGGKGGGGRSDLAQAGGPDATRTSNAVEALTRAIEFKA